MVRPNPSSFDAARHQADNRYLTKVRAAALEIDRGQTDPASATGDVDDEFDYSTPEAEAAIRAAAALVLEIREGGARPLVRKIELYERTLGLAVIPVLLRRAIYAIVNKKARRRDHR